MDTTLKDSPLGRTLAYPEQYDASLLFRIARAEGRAALGLTGSLPFFGADIWNAYELSWLNGRGKPQIAVATVIVPADSEFIVESKSFKLYLGSFAQTRMESVEALIDTIRRDVSAACGATVRVTLALPGDFGGLRHEELTGQLLDRLDLEAEIYTPEPDLLRADFDRAPVDETLVSNLLKTNCPVTGQPDWASIQFRYVGPPIDQAGLLRYIVSYRSHTGFHEQCVERMFADIAARCRPLKLAIYARYTRRGGLDINPFRTNFNLPLPDNDRTARQ